MGKSFIKSADIATAISEKGMNHIIGYNIDHKDNYEAWKNVYIDYKFMVSNYQGSLFQILMKD